MGVVNFDVLSFSGDVVGSCELNDSIFGVKYRPDILKSVVDWQLAKRRSGNHSVKTMSQVSGTTAKPHRQKGTGRARQGSLRSPQFRGGGIVFGPVVRSHMYSLNKKVRKMGLRIALSYKLKLGKLYVVDSFEDLNCDGKTRTASDAVKNFSASNRSILLVDCDVSDALKISVRNLKTVDVISVCGLNVYDVLRHDGVLLTRRSVVSLEERLS